MDQDQDKALDRAMKLLSVRARSRRELSDRILRWGYSHSTAEYVECRLTELGLVDDSEFALERVAHLLSGNGSFGLARRDLQRSGISEEAIDCALAEFEQGESEQERAVAIAYKRAASCRHLPDNKAFQRVARYLCSQGYGPDVAFEACRSVFEESNGSD